MGHRTLSLALVFRALFLHEDAYEELREDDNPFVEGLFLVVVIALVTALAQLVGQVLEWSTVPRIVDIQTAVLGVLRGQSWWQIVTGNPQVGALFQGIWDASWQLFPALFGAPDPAAAALNLLVWPVWAVAGWMVYGVLAHGFALLFGGRGTLSQTLGLTALAFAPWLLRGLEIVPFLVIGGVINTWQLILRYRALRVAHRLPWAQAMWATVLPFLLYLIFWLLLAAGVSFILALLLGR